MPARAHRPRRPKANAQEAAIAPVFAALGDATRLSVLSHLTAHGAASATVLTSRASVTRQAMTKHLTVLEKANLVASEKRGRERLWCVRPSGIDEARTYLDRVAEQWDDALARLKAFVEHE